MSVPVPAVYIPDRDTFAAQRIPGSFHIGERDRDGELSFWYCCPCGCGATAPLMAGRNFKPEGYHASWNWNGSLDAPTLYPSINHVDHWHGWLTDGQWSAC
jgi:hypothetical protein